jgi:hypothetical protein
VSSRTEKKIILTNGAGTVGTRGARVQASLGMRIALCKYGNYDEDSNGNDTKTRELRNLLEDVDQDVPVLAALGPDLERRIKKIRKNVGKCDGSVGDFVARNRDSIALVIDATDGHGVDIWNKKDLYDKHGLPFAVNGGGNKTIVSHLYFCGVLDTHSEEKEMQSRYRKENAMIVSCNTHATLTGLSRVKVALGGTKEFKKMTRGHMFLKLDRRWMDPGRARESIETGKMSPRFVSLSNEPYHVSELEYLFPELERKIQTQKGKWGTEYFHTGTMVIQFKDPVTQTLLDRIRGEFQDYDRVVFTRGDLCHERNINAAHWAGIPDGQLPCAVYTVNTIGDVGESHLLLLNFNTPQRDIVSLPTADYVLLRTGILGRKTLREAFEHVNSQGKYFGQNPARFSQSVQYSLHPDNYDRLLEEMGPAPLINGVVR